jgi:hypothetical protein
VAYDVGPGNDPGEISIAAALVLGIGANPKGNGPENDVIDFLFTFSPDTPAVVNGMTYRLMAA